MAYPKECPPISKFLKPNKAPKWYPTSQTCANNLVRMWEMVLKTESEDPAKHMYVFDIGCSEEFATSHMLELSPTLTRARAGQHGCYLSAWKRMMTLRDLMKLQGFPLTVSRGRATERQLGQMLGNAMTVPVLARIQHMVLAAAGYVD